MNTSLRLLAVVAAGSLLAGACGEAPDTEPGGTESETTQPTGSETSEPVAADFTGCLVTDDGGIDDKSFNATAWKGLTDLEDEGLIQAEVLESESEADYEPHINAFLDQDCDIIVTVGFKLGAATQAAAEANPEQLFAIVDYDFAEFDNAGNFVGDVTLPNVKELTFQTDEAAFLAGYLSAGVSQTGVVGTYGGLNIPTVTIFMDGYLAGVKHHNAEKGTDVEVLGWDGDDGLMAGTFEDTQEGRNLTDQLLAGNADIIMPVAGPVGDGTGAAIQDASGGQMMIWVDTDGYVSTTYGPIILTSVVKAMDVAVRDATEAAMDGSFEGGLYVGTLENDGVGLAPFHDFDETVTDEMKSELDALRAGIIAGEISVKPEDYA